MGGRGERLEFERGGRYIYQWLWAEPVPAVSRVVPVLALRAGGSAHTLHYAVFVLALTLNLSCHVRVVSCFLGSCSVPPI